MDHIIFWDIGWDWVHSLIPYYKAFYKALYKKVLQKQKVPYLRSKNGLARSPDLVLSPKNRFFDLDRLINIESKEFYSKSWRNNQNLKHLKTKFIHFMIQLINNSLWRLFEYANSTNFSKDFGYFFDYDHQMEKFCF